MFPYICHTAARFQSYCKAPDVGKRGHSCPQFRAEHTHTHTKKSAEPLQLRGAGLLYQVRGRGSTFAQPGFFWAFYRFELRFNFPYKG